jgi:nucleoside-diphosphate-sugar epimerase
VTPSSPAIVEGTGLLGRAFAAAGDALPRALVFARGVADSTCTDPREFAREVRCIDEALERAATRALPFVYFSGAPIYGRFNETADERTPIRPVSPYGIHQARAEDRIRAHPTRHLIIRLPNVVGDGGNEHQLVPSLRHQVNAGSVVIQERAKRDLIAVADVVRAVSALLAEGVLDRTVVVASGISTPVRDLAEWLATDLGVSPRFEMRPGGDGQQFRIDLLRSLAPSAARFDQGYPRRLIAEHVARS